MLASVKSWANTKPEVNKDDVSHVETGGVIIGAAETSMINASVGKHQGNRKPILLDHYIFSNSSDGWKRTEAMAHPTLKLNLSTNTSDLYAHLELWLPCPDIRTPCCVKVVTDTGAQSCLWSLQDFYRCRFNNTDLLSVKETMCAANTETNIY